MTLQLTPYILLPIAENLISTAANNRKLNLHDRIHGEV